jgi:hypothetical protein
MIPKEVFLSHSSKNLDMAEKVSGTLRNHGVPVWFSPTSILSAQQWHDEIGKALRRCDWFIVLLSKAAVSSQWVKSELVYALRHNQYNDHILPVMIEDCDYETLSWTLGNFQMADLTAGEEEAFTRILRTWGIGFDPGKMC